MDPNLFSNANTNSSRLSDLLATLKDYGHDFKWQAKEVIMDAGCGPGDITATVLLQWLPEDIQLLMGVDISAAMIQKSKASYSSGKLDFRVFDLCGDVSEILKDERCSNGFDKIFSFHSLQYLNDLEKGAQNLYSLLKPGGQCLISLPTKKNMQGIFKTARDKEPWSNYFKKITIELAPLILTEDPSTELTKVLEGAGFEVITCQVRPSSWKMDSMETVRGLIESLDQDINCVPSDLKTQYIDDCVDIMKNLKVLDEENHSLKSNILICVFRKPLLGSTDTCVN